MHDKVALAFDHILTVHIYSLQLEKNALTNVDVALEELRHPVDLEALPKYRKLGLIEGPELVKAARTVKPPKGAETAPQAPKPPQQQPKQPEVREQDADPLPVHLPKVRIVQPFGQSGGVAESLR